jgi:calcium/calmodulin-dependent protein kinase I
LPMTDTLVNDVRRALGREIVAVADKGAFSIVYKATDPSSGESCAVRVVVEDSPRSGMEIYVMRYAACDEILRVIDDWTLIGSGFIAMTTEFAHGGSLFDRMNRTGEPLTEKEARVVVRRLLKALASVHSVGYVHGDVKPENILLRRPDDLSSCVLADFGLAVPDRKDFSVVTSDECPRAGGTLGYAAPEAMQLGYLTSKSDIWSAGVTAYVVMAMHLPFPDYGQDAAVVYNPLAETKAILTRMRQLLVGRQAMAFIGWLVQVSPLDRPAASEALGDIWLLRRASVVCERRRSFPLIHSRTRAFSAPPVLVSC